MRACVRDVWVRVMDDDAWQWAHDGCARQCVCDVRCVCGELCDVCLRMIDACRIVCVCARARARVRCVRCVFTSDRCVWYCVCVCVCVCAFPLHRENKHERRSAGEREAAAPGYGTLTNPIAAVAREQAFGRGTGGIRSGTCSCARARLDAVFRPLILVPLVLLCHRQPAVGRLL